jgi:hypothetical protein
VIVVLFLSMFIPMIAIHGEASCGRFSVKNLEIQFATKPGDFSEEFQELPAKGLARIVGYGLVSISTSAMCLSTSKGLLKTCLCGRLGGIR